MVASWVFSAYCTSNHNCDPCRVSKDTYSLFMAVLQKHVKKQCVPRCEMLQHCLHLELAMAAIVSCEVSRYVQCTSKHSAQMWHGRLWIVAGQMYNLNRGGWYIAVTGSGIEISLENYSNSRFLLLELPLCYSDRQRTLLKLWFPTMEQKIFLVPGSDSQAPQSCLLKF